MIYQLRRHPLPIEARFDHCLVLTYAGLADVLQTHLPPGLEVERLNEEFGFMAIALVQTRSLRPAGWPALLGRDFFLSGYRIFCRYRRPDGRTLRGLRILRSDTDRRAMVFFGNLLTHYNYHRAAVHWNATPSQLDLTIDTPGHEADLTLRAFLDNRSAPLPPDSCFRTVKEARRFAGPLPYTFDYERETNSMVAIKAERADWRPRPIQVEVTRNTFIENPAFQAAKLRMVSAFYTAGIGYRWQRGIRFPLMELK